MKYEQQNPVPIPDSGEYQHVKSTLDTVFDWEYSLRKQNLLGLYEKGKANVWNATELDWSTEVSIEKMMRDRAQSGAANVMNSVMKPPKVMSERELVELNLNMNAFMLSQFLHGEQGALLATAKIVQTVPWEEAKFYAAVQVADEARHVEVFHRYLTEKLGVSYQVNPSLQTLLSDIIMDSRWDVTFLGMQIMVEGLALAAFGLMRMMMPDEPLIQDLTTRVIQDESRHVAFGVMALEKIYSEEMSSQEIREREDFVIEATHLLRERLLMHQIFERLEWDVPVWVDWAQETPFMRGFRQMTFSKIVPNLKRLGLLTPRVRSAYEKMDLLRFEDMKDSIDEPEPTPPTELVQTLMQFLAQSSAPETGQSAA